MNKTSFYDEIRSNKLKTTLLIILFSILLLFIGYVVGIIFFNNALLGLILAFFISFVLIMFSYFNGDSIVLKVSRAVEAKKPQYTYLINTVEGLAIAAGIPKPKVWVINDENPNAFATGRNPENSHVAVTTGLLNLMNREELEGVIAHELSHIKNYDIRYMMIVGVMVGMAVIIQEMVEGDFSGVVFTVDPVYNNFILIEAVSGLGEQLVSGKITPNSYFIFRDTMEIKEFSEEIKMDKEIIKKMGKIALSIEKDFGNAQDIEFTIKEKDIYILQTRPITTLKKGEQK